MFPLDTNERFEIIITARILKTPHPAQPITIATHLNPFAGITDGAFDDISCISQSGPTGQSSQLDSPESSPHKAIRLAPTSRPHYIWDPDDLAASWNFVTIPSQESATPFLTISHEVPMDRIVKAGLVVGERYRVNLTKEGLGTRWWAFGSLDMELAGLKLKQRRLRVSIDGEGRQQGDIAFGEKPEQLSLVVEGTGAEFGIVSAYPKEEV